MSQNLKLPCTLLQSNRQFGRRRFTGALLFDAKFELCGSLDNLILAFLTCNTVYLFIIECHTVNGIEIYIHSDCKSSKARRRYHAAGIKKVL